MATATIPQASTSISSSAGAQAGSSDYEVVIGCVNTSADIVPRVFASASAALSQHGYSPAVDYAGLKIAGTRKPVMFIGLPVTTAGAAAQLDTSAELGTSLFTVTAAAGGIMEETASIVTVVTGGTVGTAGITFTYSADGGRNTVLVNLGTATSYTVPNLGIVLNFGPGTLLAADVMSFVTSAPMWQQTDFASAFTALVAQQLLARSVQVVGEIADSTHAGYVTAQVDAYETANQRFMYARCNVKDRLPLAKCARAQVSMQTGASLTFIAGDTCTRATGSWLTDGFAVGDMVTFTATGGLNTGVSAIITTLTTTIMTCSATTFTAEVSATNYSVVGSPELAFAVTANTITATSGLVNFLHDGFAPGQLVSIAGTTSNNVTSTSIITVTATVMTVSATLANENKPAASVTIQQVNTMSSFISSATTAFASVSGEKRIDIAIGRARVPSTITPWEFRRPVAWACGIREYQHTEQIPTWRKSDGPLLNWDMTNGNNLIVEYDERTIGGALAGGFTCLRTYGNGPEGSFVAMSLTRDVTGSLLSLTHNMAVVDIFQGVVQATTENMIGQVLVLDASGHGTPDSLQKLAQMVNSQLQLNLLQDQGEGQLASLATWTPSNTDVLNVPNATLHGVGAIELNGTLVNINTVCQVQTAG